MRSDSGQAGAALLTNTLPGGTDIFTAVLPYGGSYIYFAHRWQNVARAWSGVSNNAFWPSSCLYLPLVVRKYAPVSGSVEIEAEGMAVSTAILPTRPH